MIVVLAVIAAVVVLVVLVEGWALFAGFFWALRSGVLWRDSDYRQGEREAGREQED